MIVRRMDPVEPEIWDTFVRSRPIPSLYHLSSWLRAIEHAYRHKTYYLTCIDDSDLPIDKEVLRQSSNTYHHSEAHHSSNATPQQPNIKIAQNQVIGILPLVHMKHLLFGNRLISIPFSDYGGTLSSGDAPAKALMGEAVKLAEHLRIDGMELRHIDPLSCIKDAGFDNSAGTYKLLTRFHKVRMILNLPISSQDLFDSFKSKLKNQIRKPQKEGLNAKIGGIELLDHFYDVFSANMRDLGSPVHSKKLIRSVLKEFGKAARIIIVYGNHTPAACGLIAGVGNLLVNPWASFLRSFSRQSPNMLLYWKMLEYACDNRFAYFDFGRSTPFEGTYHFKEQWGAKAHPLAWQYFVTEREGLLSEDTDSPQIGAAIRLWKRLPVSLANLFGPYIRKHISL